MSGINVLIVDSNPFFAAAVRHLAADMANVASCTWVTSCRAGVKAVSRLRPDLILADLAMVVTYCPDAAQRIATGTDAPSLVLMSAVRDVANLSEDHLARADAYVCREELADVLPVIIADLRERKLAKQAARAVAVAKPIGRQGAALAVAA